MAEMSSLWSVARIEDIADCLLIIGLDEGLVVGWLLLFFLWGTGGFK